MSPQRRADGCAPPRARAVDYAALPQLLLPPALGRLSCFSTIPRLTSGTCKKRRKKEKKPVARGAGEKWRCWWYRAGGHARDRMPLSQQAARSSSDGGSGLLGENPPRWRGKSPGRVSRRWPAWEKPTTWWGKAQAGCAACPRSSARRLVLSLCHGRMLRSQASRTSSYGCSLWPTRGKTHRSGAEKALAG